MRAAAARAARAAAVAEAAAAAAWGDLSLERLCVGNMGEASMVCAEGEATKATLIEGEPIDGSETEADIEAGASDASFAAGFAVGLAAGFACGGLSGGLSGGRSGPTQLLSATACAVRRRVGSGCSSERTNPLAAAESEAARCAWEAFEMRCCNTSMVSPAKAGLPCSIS